MLRKKYSVLNITSCQNVIKTVFGKQLSFLRNVFVFYSKEPQNQPTKIRHFFTINQFTLSNKWKEKLICESFESNQ